MKPNFRFLSIYFMVLLFLISVNTELFSQEIMKIRKKDNTVISIPTADIAGITYSSSEQIVPENEIKDVNGTIYKTVKIGFQSWTEKNLDVTSFRNGDQIAEAKTDEDWVKAGKKGKPAWCYYLNNSEYGHIYGKLYNWYAVNDKRGLAPKGWRVAMDQDWDAMLKFLGETPGAKLKEIGKTNWIKNTDNVTNETGFSAVPGGSRFNSGKFSSVGSQGILWANTENGLNQAWARIIYDYNSSITKFSYDKNCGLSVRCVKE